MFDKHSPCPMTGLKFLIIWRMSSSHPPSWGRGNIPAGGHQQLQTVAAPQRPSRGFFQCTLEFVVVVFIRVSKARFKLSESTPSWAWQKSTEEKTEGRAAAGCSGPSCLNQHLEGGSASCQVPDRRYGDTQKERTLFSHSEIRQSKHGRRWTSSGTFPAM